MRTEARIHTLCWSDAAFLALSWRSQHAYFCILSQSQVSLAGVCDLQIRRWGHLCGDHRGNEMGRAVAQLERNKFVVIDRTTNELWIRTFVKYDGVLSSPNLIVAMSRDFALIMSATIRDAFIAQLGEGFLEGLPEGLWKRLAKPFQKGLREGFPLACARYAEPPLLTTSPPPNEQTLPGSFGAANGTSPPEPIEVVHPDVARELAEAIRNRSQAIK